ncbi:MAG: lipopolysaccharide heptosyltransferase II [Pseudomonadales bacterium]
MAGPLLVIGPAWVGDMMMSQALYRLLKSADAERPIDFLAPGWSLPLLALMPEVRHAWEMPLGHGQLELVARYRMARQLRQSGYEQAIVLPNSFKSALIPYWAKIPKRTGWRGEMRYRLLNDVRILDKQEYPLMVQRFLALGLDADAKLPHPLPHPYIEVDADLVTQTLTSYEINADKPIIALCPGAEFGPAKQWPEEYFATLAQQKIDDGYQIFLLGSANDQTVVRAIIEALPEAAREFCNNLAGKTKLADATLLMAAADAVVCNDSGLLHIAAALNKPLIAIYGSTSPSFTPPLADRVAIQSLAVDCGPCFQRTCPLGHLKCLTGVTPARVVASLDELLVAG